jgi:alkylhydroperoxidase family enzyme
MYEEKLDPKFYIKHVKREDADGAIAEIYMALPQDVMVPGPVLIKSIVPELAGMNAQELGYYASRESISPMVMAAIRYVLAVGVNSAYCTNVNGRLLIRGGFPEEQFQTLLDKRTAPFFSEKENALIAFAIAAAEKPKGVTAKDIETVRSAGWDDSELLIAVTNAINSVAGINVFKAFQIKE